MASPAIDVHLGAPDPSWHPSNMVDLFARIDERLTGAFASDTGYIPYVISSTTPSVDDQDKVWIKLDGGGRPIGTFLFYAGNWRRTFTGLASEVKVFSGDPTVYFDGTGKGILGNDWDGWALCNGQNGTTDLSDKFIIAGHMNNTGGVTGYVGGWRTNVAGAPQNTGGVDHVELGPNYIYRAPTDAVVVGKWKADSNARTSDGSGQLFGEVGTSADDSFQLIPQDPGNTNPFPFSIINPFYAYALAAFIGYT
jgi:hypothetical protein